MTALLLTLALLLLATVTPEPASRALLSLALLGVVASLWQSVRAMRN